MRGEGESFNQNNKDSSQGVEFIILDIRFIQLNPFGVSVTSWKSFSEFEIVQRDDWKFFTVTKFHIHTQIEMGSELNSIYKKL